MPRISYFFGVSVYMFHTDHNPPHFHAIYGGHGAGIMISTGQVLSGRLPPRALRLVLEWLELHREQLAADWDLARRKLPLQVVPPLE
jgi:hypothetical protein